MSKKEDAIRFAYGAVTLACEDLARAMESADEETAETLNGVFDLAAKAQSEAESLYLRHVKNAELAVGDKDTVFLAIPKDLEQQIRNTLAVLQSSNDAENEFGALADEIKTFVRVVSRGRSFGSGAKLVVDRLTKRAKGLRDFGKSLDGTKQSDYLPAADLEAIRAEVRAEIESKMLNAADRLRELRDMIRAKRAEMD